MKQLRNLVSLVEYAQRQCKGNPCYEERSLGWECFSQQVLVVTKRMWGSAQWLLSIGCGLAHMLRFPWQPKHSSIMYSTSSLAPPATLHWWKDLSISCLGKPAFLQQFYIGLITTHLKSLCILGTQISPQILGQSCQMLVSRYGSRSCIQHKGFGVKEGRDEALAEEGVLLRKDFRMRAFSFKHLYKALYKVRKQRLEKSIPKDGFPSYSWPQPLVSQSLWGTGPMTTSSPGRQDFKPCPNTGSCEGS